MVTESPCILGVCLTAAKRRKCTTKEQQRIDDSCRMISRAGFLPVSLDCKMTCINLGPLSKLAFGWFMQVPTLAQCNRVEQLIRRALHEPVAASKHLARILRGHMFDFNFRACDASLSAAWRLVKTTACDVPSSIRNPLLRLSPKLPSSACPCALRRLLGLSEIRVRGSWNGSEIRSALSKPKTVRCLTMQLSTWLHAVGQGNG